MRRWAIFLALLVVAIPARAVVLQDINGDTKKTVCFVGDSITFNNDLYTYILANLPEPDNIIRCAAIGYKIGDIQASWSDILDGTANDGFMACTAKRGSLAKCDYALLMIGANNSNGASGEQNLPTGFCFQRGCVGGSDAGDPCKDSSECGGGGTCTNQQGPQHGQSCGIVTGEESLDGQFFVASYYCAGGDDIGECCATSLTCGSPVTCTGWTGKKICQTGADTGKLCSSSADCAGAAACSPPGNSGSADFTDETNGPGFCMRGDPTDTSTCPKGLCVRQTSTAYFAATLTSMINIAAARTGSSAVQLILAGNTDTQSVVGIRDGSVIYPKHCLGGTSTPRPFACTVDGDCGTGGVCLTTVQDVLWNYSLPWVRWINRWEASLGLPYVDVGGYLRRLARQAGDVDGNLEDGVHMSTTGETRQGAALVACLTEDSSVPENHCGAL